MYLLNVDRWADRELWLESSSGVARTISGWFRVSRSVYCRDRMSFSRCRWVYRYGFECGSSASVATMSSRLPGSIAITRRSSSRETRLTWSSAQMPRAGRCVSGGGGGGFVPCFLASFGSPWSVRFRAACRATSFAARCARSASTLSRLPERRCTRAQTPSVEKPPSTRQLCAMAP